MRPGPILSSSVSSHYLTVPVVDWGQGSTTLPYQFIGVRDRDLSIPVIGGGQGSGVASLTYIVVRATLKGPVCNILKILRRNGDIKRSDFRLRCSFAPPSFLPLLSLPVSYSSLRTPLATFLLVACLTSPLVSHRRQREEAAGEFRGLRTGLDGSSELEEEAQEAGGRAGSS